MTSGAHRGAAFDHIVAGNLAMAERQYKEKVKVDDDKCRAQSERRIWGQDKGKVRIKGRLITQHFLFALLFYL